MKTPSEDRKEENKEDEEAGRDRTSIKPPTSNLGIFAVFEACIPGQVPLKWNSSGASEARSEKGGAGA